MKPADINNDMPGLSQRLLEYRDVLFSYIFTLVRDYADAEELFQETALIVLKKEKEGIQVKHFGAWSREIARRKALEYIKKKKNRNRVFLSVEATDILEDEFALREREGETGIAEMLLRLKQCVQELPVHLRKLIDLRYSNGLSFKEIGKQIKRSAGASQVALARTRQKLLECVQRLKETKGKVRNES